MGENYIIIQSNGKPLNIADIDYVIIYANEAESLKNLVPTDLGLVKIDYSKDAHGNDTAIVSEPARYHKLHGVFTFDDNSENDFQAALKKFLEEKPFTER